VQAQYRLVTEKFGVKKLPLVTGWSMGALQTFHWGALLPDMVERIAPDFLAALKVGKQEADERMQRSLYMRGVGYSYDAVKIFMPAGARKPIYAPYVEHVPPDPTSAIFWLKNRDPAHWRDAWQLDHTFGKYVISDKPMTRRCPPQGRPALQRTRHDHPRRRSRLTPLLERSPCVVDGDVAVLRAPATS